jgi:small subunit ribosomal protein S6
MTVYDSTFILNPQLEEGGLDASIKDAVDLITAHGGKIVKENRIGMRRMAYEIQKITQGYYVSLVFEGSHETVLELERKFRLNEACLRFLTCHYQDFSRKKERNRTSRRTRKKQKKHRLTKVQKFPQKKLLSKMWFPRTRNWERNYRFST